MRKQQRLTKPTDIFRRKIVITVPPWGVFVLGGIIAIALGVQVTDMLVVFLLIIVLCALISTVRIHRIWHEMRYEIHNILHDIENEGMGGGPTFEEFTPDQYPDRIPLKGINGNRRQGVPKR